jgi:hypothetical protein
MKELKNSLESYAYNMRQKLDEDYSQYVDANTKANLLKDINEVIEWLYQDSANNSNKE